MSEMRTGGFVRPKRNVSLAAASRVIPAEEAKRGLSSFPTGIFLFVVIAVCVGLAVSAGYGYVILTRLRVEYLENRGADIASALDMQMRGPGVRNRESAWQRLFAESMPRYEGSVAFFALVSGSGNVLASEGSGFSSLFATQPGFASAGGEDVYIFDMALGPPRGFRGGFGIQTMDWHLRIGLYASFADFIRWQGITYVAMTGVAIATLLALSFYFLTTLRRFLRLKAREEADRHLAALGAMAATLAHEIRNPLGAMKGLTQLAQEDLPKDHNTQSLMNTVVAEAERLEQLVTDLLTFARPKAPQINRFDLIALATSLRDVLQPKLEAGGITLKIESKSGALPVDTDESGMKQVLLNVLLNAIDVTPAGGVVSITAGREDKPHRIVIEIADEGPGLGGRDPEGLFQPFVTTKTKGTGLGLPISRQIIERLGGRITLAERSGGGALCTLEFPLSG